jgi:hypothetical protein
LARERKFAKVPIDREGLFFVSKSIALTVRDRETLNEG